MNTADQVLSEFSEWAGGSEVSSQSHILPVALLQALLAASVAGGSGGGGTASGDTPETITFYSDVLADLQALLTAIEGGSSSEETTAFYTANLARLQSIIDAVGVGADTAAAANYYTAAVARLTAIQAALEGGAPSALTTEAQTLNAPGLSNSIAIAGKTSVAVQLLWTGASTTQVVRLRGSFDGGTTWHLLDTSLAGQSFSTTDIADYAAAGLQPGLRWDMPTPALTHIRLSWVSGNGTLALKWGIA